MEFTDLWMRVSRNRRGRTVNFFGERFFKLTADDGKSKVQRRRKEGTKRKSMRSD